VWACPAKPDRAKKDLWLIKFHNSQSKKRKKSSPSPFFKDGWVDSLFLKSALICVTCRGVALKSEDGHVLRSFSEEGSADEI
jgi:hypothetical protein